MGKTNKPDSKSNRHRKTDPPFLLTLEVTLREGPLSRHEEGRSPALSRTIQVRSDQTLADLHRGIFQAFGRKDEHFYEFQTRDRHRYIMPMAADAETAAGLVTETKLADLHLETGSRLAYLFDFASDWWHPIEVKSISDQIPEGHYPRIIRALGDNPPADLAALLLGEAPHDLRGNAAADTALLIGEMHLRNRDYLSAIAAFTRAIETNPTPDAFEGRAQAYHGIAALDEQQARDLRERR